MGLDSFFRGLDNVASALAASREAAEQKQAQRLAAIEHDTAISECSPKLQTLLEYYAEPRGSLSRAVKWYRANVEATTEGDMLIGDLTKMIRDIVLPQDEIRHTDGRLLCAFGLLAQLVVEDFNTQDGIEFIEEFRPYEAAGWMLPGALKARGDADLERVVTIYLSLATTIARSPETARDNRQVGLRAVRKELTAFITEDSSDTKALPDMTHGDNRYSVLKVEAGCSMDDLKVAYRKEAALWHPDKLAHLAPELRKHAEQQMAVINEAYESLCAEYEEAD